MNIDQIRMSIMQLHNQMIDCEQNNRWVEYFQLFSERYRLMCQLEKMIS